MSISSLVTAALKYRSAKCVRILKYHPQEAFGIHERTRNTTLHIFVRNDDAKLVEMVLRAGVSVTALNARKEVALHLAKSAAVVRLLLAHGAHAQVHSMDHTGYAPRRCACSHCLRSKMPLHRVESARNGPSASQRTRPRTQRDGCFLATAQT